MLLLSNASATGTADQWPGGRGHFSLVGTVGGATISLQIKGPDGSTFVTTVKADGSTAASLTAAGCMVVDLPPCNVKAVVTGGSPSALYARLERIPR